MKQRLLILCSVLLFSLWSYAQHYTTNPTIGKTFEGISQSRKGIIEGTCGYSYTGGSLKLRVSEVRGKDLRFEAQWVDQQGKPAPIPATAEYHIKEGNTPTLSELVCGDTKGSLTFNKGTTVGAQTLTPGNFTDGMRYYCAVLIIGNTRYYSNAVRVIASQPKPFARTDKATIGTYMATAIGTLNGYGLSTNYYFQYGTSERNLNQSTAETFGASGTGEFEVKAELRDLKPQTVYYYRLVAKNNAGTSYGEIKTFSTGRAWSLPTIGSTEATNIKSTTVTLVGELSVNSSSGQCFFKYGPTSTLGKTTAVQFYTNTDGTRRFSFDLSLLAPNTTYYYRFYAGNDPDYASSQILTFTTSRTEPSNPDSGSSSGTSSGQCDLKGLPTSNLYYGATAFLCERGVLSGSQEDGRVEVEHDLKRAHLAKIAFRGLYSLRGRTVPTSVPSDVYPSVYADIATQTAGNSYYYQAARALMYLEYGDGVSPFDRNRLNFEPGATITRIDVLKMLCETFNIKPDVGGTSNPFPNDANCASLLRNNPVKFGYLRRAATLGIIATPSGGKNESFRPYDDCLRGEAFLILANIIRKIEAGSLTDPNPTASDYFEPLNLTAKTLATGVGLQMGNFNHYTKSSFAIDGVVPLTFAHEYNSYNTTLPEAFYAGREVSGKQVAYQPLGTGWSHSYHSFITLVGEGSEERAIVHWGGGGVHVYVSDGGQRMLPESMGIYDVMERTASGMSIRTKDKTTYEFSQQGNASNIFYLSRVYDRNGNTLILNYTTGLHDFKVLSSVSDGQRALTFRYKSGTNLLESVIDPIGRSINYRYNYNAKLDSYVLTAYTDAENHTTNYYYVDPSNRATAFLLKRIQLPKGNYIENEYEANRRLKQSIAGLNGVPQSKTAISVTADYRNQARTNSVMQVERSGKTASFAYNYNSNNVLTSMRGEEGSTLEARYGSSTQPQLPTYVKTNDREFSDITYDTRGNVTSVTIRSLDGNESYTSRLSYDTDNNLTSSTDHKGTTTYYTYDNKGNLTHIRGAEGTSVSLTLDGRGLPTMVRSAEGVETTYHYNRYGNPTQILQQAIHQSHTLSYDGVSRLTSVTNALGNTTRYRYNGVDLLTEETNPAGHSTRYTYDANDNMTSITNAKGGITSMTYDNTTDWLRSLSFGGATRRYEYNKDGTLQSLTKADGRQLNYSYDNLGRLLSDGINSYTYDSRMNLSTIQQGNKTITYSYDGFNRVSAVHYNDFSGNRTTYEYDANSNITRMTYPDGKAIRYTYDALNRLTAVTDWRNRTIRYTYNRDSKLLRTDYPNGMHTAYTYDAGGRLTGKTTQLRNGKTIAAYAFALDHAGNITTQTATEPYTTSTVSEETVDYSYNTANRVQRAGTLHFAFDSNGNTLQRGSERYTWDVADRLTRVADTTLSYDPMGNLRQYGATRYLTDLHGIGHIIAEANARGDVSHYYLHGAGLEARISKHGAIAYYVTDVRGSVVALVDDNGDITHKYQYDDFGKVMQASEKDFNPFRYVGAYGVLYLNDHLYYMRARHYDPTIGRFLSEDPIWSTNLYPYADNNPIMGIDPKGEAFEAIGTSAAVELAPIIKELFALETLVLGKGAAGTKALLAAKTKATSTMIAQTKTALTTLAQEIGKSTLSKSAIPKAAGFITLDALVAQSLVAVTATIIMMDFKQNYKLYQETGSLQETLLRMPKEGGVIARSGNTIGSGIESLINQGAQKIFGQDVKQKLYNSKFGHWYRSTFN